MIEKSFHIKNPKYKLDFLFSIFIFFLAKGMEN